MEIFFTFENTHAVILAEQALLSADIPTKVRPVPNAIRAGCGLCLCVAPKDRVHAQTALGKKGVSVAETYKVENGIFTIWKEN